MPHKLIMDIQNHPREHALKAHYDKLKSKHKQDLRVLEMISLWPFRLKLLQEKEGISENVFCVRNKINAARFNRCKNFKEIISYDSSFFKAVEEAFTKEGV